jgi:hypothetical protein
VTAARFFYEGGGGSGKTMCKIGCLQADGDIRRRHGSDGAHPEQPVEVSAPSRTPGGAYLRASPAWPLTSADQSAGAAAFGVTMWPICRSHRRKCGK